jgi:hypothetical protein
MEQKRLHNLDFLRGYFILLALYQHFCFYTNLWFTNYFDEMNLLNTVYANFAPYIDNVLPVTSANTFLHRWFTPWVSQVYLMMAAFNLASRKGTSFTKQYTGKIKIFATLFLFFIFENFIMSRSFGEAFTLYPLLTWMIVLALIATVYRFTGIKGVVALFLIHCLKWPLPIDQVTHSFISYMENNFHPSFDIDARIDHFLGSGCLGFIFGYAYYHKDWNEMKLCLTPFVVGSLLALNWKLFGPVFYIDVENVLATEHLATETFIGTLGIWGIQLYVLSFFLYIERYRNISLKIPVVNWVGEHSLSVFSIHRIFFVFILMPSTVYIYARLDIELVNSFPFIWSCVGITVFTGWFIRKIRMQDIIFK